ncbi:hypothetical protein CesoFtcFv8_023537 [Champsocephalus esox]|uniref:Uncharacterized protein n=1 Tax=Champsocephalus esox TaxID=159716 RepID=A0AAN8B919_9TELE|nr:hypothetical protein CesoFtcFv8_023537 [Champsocephalus esox]
MGRNLKQQLFTEPLLLLLEAVVLFSGADKDLRRRRICAQPQTYISETCEHSEGSGSGVRHSVSSTHWRRHQNKNLQITYNSCAYSAYATPVMDAAEGALVAGFISSVLPTSSTNELALEAHRKMGVDKVED